MDTSLAAHRRHIELLRRMSPQEKIRLTFEMMETVKKVREAGRKHDESRDRSDV